MKIDKLASSKNDEFYTPRYAIEPILKYVKIMNPRKIWCPFDTEESQFVKVFRENDFDVIATHKDTGTDFFFCKFPECDLIVSNPPYSLKTEVLQKLFNQGTPFAMLVGLSGLFESQKRFNIFKNNPFQIMYLNKRVSYLNELNEVLPSINPPFPSVYIGHNFMDKMIAFEEINKKVIQTNSS